MPNELPNEEEISRDEWGDGTVVSHWGEGKWVKYDPDDTVDVSNWR